jgi:hypothetical protein
MTLSLERYLPLHQVFSTRFFFKIMHKNIDFAQVICIIRHRFSYEVYNILGSDLETNRAIPFLTIKQTINEHYCLSVVQ